MKNCCGKIITGLMLLTISQYLFRDSTFSENFFASSLNHVFTLINFTLRNVCFISCFQTVCLFNHICVESLWHIVRLLTILMCWLMNFTVVISFRPWCHVDLGLNEQTWAREASWWFDSLAFITIKLYQKWDYGPILDLAF